MSEFEQSWQESIPTSPEVTPEMDELASLAATVGYAVEHAPSSDDEQAFRLGSVVVGGGTGFESDLTYILEPPKGLEDTKDVKALFVTMSGRRPSRSDISLLPAQATVSPYYAYAHTYTPINFERNVDPLLEACVDHMMAHGIEKSHATVVYTDGDKAKYESLLEALPFTKTLSSTPGQLMEQYPEVVRPSEMPAASDSLRLSLGTLFLAEQLVGANTIPVLQSPEAHELPAKPLAECNVSDLDDLSEVQLAELLFKASRYGDRTFDIFMGSAMYDFVIKPPQQERVYKIDGQNTAVTFKEAEEGLLPHVKIELPHIEYGSFISFREGLPVINAKLRELGIPELSEYSFRRADQRKFETYWSRDPATFLHEHNYGDGGLFATYETPESVLAQEVKELQELGFDFKDIIDSLDAVVTDLRQAFFAKYDPLTKNKGLFEVTSMGLGTLPKYYDYRHKSDPTLYASTVQWRSSVVDLPFKGVESSVLDHTLGRATNKNWLIPISETSLSLYKNRVVEGYYSPHYRISAARTVWAMELGTPEQQAKALALDWQRSAAHLQWAAANRNRTGINTAMNYMINFFPRDDTRWRKDGFPGYNYDGETYPSLTAMLYATKAKYEHIQYPKGVIMVGSQTTMRDIE